VRPNGLQELPTTGTAVLVGRGGIGGIGPRERDALVLALADGLGDALVLGADGRGRTATGGAGGGVATVISAIGAGINASGRTAGLVASAELVDDTTWPESTCRSPTDTAGWRPVGRAITITIRTAMATATTPAIGMPMDANDRARLCRPMIPLRPRAYCRVGSLPSQPDRAEARPHVTARPTTDTPIRVVSRAVTSGICGRIGGASSSPRGSTEEERADQERDRQDE
jgi:hypothetical protein